MRAGVLKNSIKWIFSKQGLIKKNNLGGIGYFRKNPNRRGVEDMEFPGVSKK